MIDYFPQNTEVANLHVESANTSFWLWRTSLFGMGEQAVATVKGKLLSHYNGERLFSSTVYQGETAWGPLRPKRSKHCLHTGHTSNCSGVLRQQTSQRTLPTWLAPRPSVWITTENTHSTIIQQIEAPRSYLVRTEKGLFKRNCTLLFASHQPTSDAHTNRLSVDKTTGDPDTTYVRSSGWHSLWDWTYKGAMLVGKLKENDLVSVLVQKKWMGSIIWINKANHFYVVVKC